MCTTTNSLSRQHHHDTRRPPPPPRRHILKKMVCLWSDLLSCSRCEFGNGNWDGKGRKRTMIVGRKSRNGTPSLSPRTPHDLAHDVYRPLSPSTLRKLNTHVVLLASFSGSTRLENGGLSSTQPDRTIDLEILCSVHRKSLANEDARGSMAVIDDNRLQETAGIETNKRFSAMQWKTTRREETRRRPLKTDDRPAPTFR